VVDGAVVVVVDGAVVVVVDGALVVVVVVVDGALVVVESGRAIVDTVGPSATSSRTNPTAAVVTAIATTVPSNQAPRYARRVRMVS
jgi:hypothetical protein